MGSRYGGLKQVEPLGPGGETLLDYSVFDAVRAGFARVVFIIRRDFETLFRERVGRRFESRVASEYVFQDLDRLPADRTAVPLASRAKPWGTGHAVWCAAGAIDTDFAVINADDFYGRDAFAQLAQFFARAAAAKSSATPARFAMAGYRLADTLSEHGAVSRGICRVDERRRLASIEEMTGIEAAPGGAGQIHRADGTKVLLPAHTTVSMNCWGFSPAVFPLLEAGLAQFLAERGADAKAEFYLPAAIEAAVATGAAEVEVLPVRASWFGITHREDRPRVGAALEQLITAGEYPRQLWR